MVGGGLLPARPIWEVLKCLLRNLHPQRTYFQASHSAGAHRIQGSNGLGPLLLLRGPGKVVGARKEACPQLERGVHPAFQGQ